MPLDVMEIALPLMIYFTVMFWRVFSGSISEKDYVETLPLLLLQRAIILN
jgi:hypothetical protein